MTTMMEKSKDSVVAADAKISETIHPNEYLSKTNFEYFHWPKARHLRIHNCDLEIKSEKLDCCEDKITTLHFSGLNSYTNIKILLHRCTNLKHLSLSNIVLNHYETDYKRFYIIEASELSTITISGSGKLTKDEMHLLDFFFRRVRFANLKSIGFRTEGKREIDTRKKTNLTLRNNFTKSSVNSTAVCNFLAQNRHSLRSLIVTRAGIPLQNERFDKENEVETFDPLKLQLDYFECDMATSGYDKILNSQNNLQTIINHNKRGCHPAAVEALMNTIRRCSDTLREINVTQTAKSRLEEDSEDLLQHDCTVYKSCHKLERLYINVSNPEDLFDTDSRGKKPGAILNIRFLPLSVSHLILKFDFISLHGMELFMSRIPKMSQLKFFVLHGNRAAPFKARSSWVILLLNHPKIEVFEFNNCAMDDIEQLARFQSSKGDAAKYYLKASENHCLYWRESTEETKYNSYNCEEKEKQ